MTSSGMSVSDVLASEVTALVKTPLFRLEEVDHWNSSLVSRRDIAHELQDQGKPYQHLCKTLEGVKHEVAKRQQERAKVSKEVSDVTKSSKDLEAKLETLQAEIRKKESALQVMEAKVKTKSGQLDDQKVILAEYSEKINKYLGLDVAVLEGESPRFVFTLDIGNGNGAADDVTNGGGKCCFELSLDPETKLYRIESVEPEIKDPEFIDKMQKLLNENNDLSGLAVALRKKFKKKT